MQVGYVTEKALCLYRRFRDGLPRWAFKRSKLAESHRSRTCPGPLAAPTGFEVQPPHRRRRPSAPALLHGGGAHYSYFQAVTTLFERKFYRICVYEGTTK